MRCGKSSPPVLTMSLTSPGIGPHWRNYANALVHMSSQMRLGVDINQCQGCGVYMNGTMLTFPEGDNG